MAKRKKPTKEKTLLDVIVVTGGRFDMLRLCIKALEAQTDCHPFQVFVIDNATDGKERLENKDIFESPVITGTKRFTQEEGFPRANNEAARMGNSPLILFLNDDVELQPTALKEMISTLDDPDVGIVGAKLTFPEGSQSGPAGKVQHVGMALNINGDVIHPLIAWRADHPKCCVTREVMFVTGACLMIRRSLFKEAGGFWEGYGMGSYEDCDLCMSVKYLGKKVVINANAQGTHFTNATARMKNRGFPVQANGLTFRARWVQSGLFSWTDWMWW